MDREYFHFLPRFIDIIRQALHLSNEREERLNLITKTFARQLLSRRHN